MNDQGSVLLGVELIDKYITKLQCHIRVQHRWLVDGGVVPYYDPPHQQKSTFLISSYSILLHLIPLILGVRRE